MERLLILFKNLYHCIKVNSFNCYQVVNTFNFPQLPILIVLNHAIIHTFEYKIMFKMKMSEMHTVNL